MKGREKKSVSFTIKEQQVSQEDKEVKESQQGGQGDQVGEGTRKEPDTNLVNKIATGGSIRNPPALTQLRPVIFLSSDISISPTCQRRDVSPEC